MKWPTLECHNIYMLDYSKQTTLCEIKNYLIQWKILLFTTCAILLLALGCGVALSLKYHLAEPGKFPNTTSPHSEVLHLSRNEASGYLNLDSIFYIVENDKKCRLIGLRSLFCAVCQQLTHYAV